MAVPSGVALLKAVVNKSAVDVRNLLDQGVYVDYRDFFGRTPLYLAVERNSYNIAKMLLEAGANVNTRPLSGIQSPLEAAIVLHGDDLMVHLLLLYGADVEFCDDNKKSPLFIAVELKLYAIALLLLEFQADVNLKNKYGRTLLDLAVVIEDRLLISMLLNWNAVLTDKQIFFFNSYPYNMFRNFNSPVHLVKHYIKLCQAKLTSGNYMLLDIPEERFHLSGCNCKAFERICQMEVKEMKTHFIGPVSFYTMLSNPRIDPWFATRERRFTLSKSSFVTSFPNYGGLLTAAFTNAWIRNCLLDSLCSFDIKLGNGENERITFELPMEISRKILNTLSNKELKRIFTIIRPGRLW